MDKDRRRRLRDACEDRDKVFTAEIVLQLLDRLDAADTRIENLERAIEDHIFRESFEDPLIIQD